MQVNTSITLTFVLSVMLSGRLISADSTCQEEFQKCGQVILSLGDSPTITTLCSSSRLKACRDNLNAKCKGSDQLSFIGFQLVNIYDRLCSPEGMQGYTNFVACSTSGGASQCENERGAQGSPDPCSTVTAYVDCINRTCDAGAAGFASTTEEFTNVLRGRICGFTPIEQCSDGLVNCTELMSGDTCSGPDGQEISPYSRCLYELQQSCNNPLYIQIITSRIKKLNYTCSSQGMRDMANLANCTARAMNGYRPCRDAFDQSRTNDADICRAAKEHIACTLKNCGEEAARYINMTAFPASLCSSGGAGPKTTPSTGMKIRNGSPMLYAEKAALLMVLFTVVFKKLF